MSSDLAKLRAAAEPYKSFPAAVAAVVRAMFDKGAMRVVVSFRPCLIVDLIGGSGGKVDRLVPSNRDLTIHGLGLGFAGWFEITDERFSTKIMNEPGSRWLAAYIHHARVAETCGQAYTMQDLGECEGVNPKQDRSAKRLIRELPRHLSPSESYRTVVVDESGEVHRLVKNIHEVTKDGFIVSWPERMVGYNQDGLTLKSGSARVPIAPFLRTVPLKQDEHVQLSILTHPWVQGVIEVSLAKDGETAPGAVVASRASSCGDAALVRALLASEIPGVIIQQMGKLVTGFMRDFSNKDHEFVLGDHRYAVTCARPFEIRHAVDRVLFRDPLPSAGGVTNLLLDVTHPVFRTVSTYDQEVMQIVWWQLAMWIQFHDNEVFAGEPDAMVRTNKIYLALREQNPERSWDDE